MASDTDPDSGSLGLPALVPVGCGACPAREVAAVAEPPGGGRAGALDVHGRSRLSMVREEVEAHECRDDAAPGAPFLVRLGRRPPAACRHAHRPAVAIGRRHVAGSGVWDLADDAGEDDVAASIGDVERTGSPGSSTHALST